MYNIFQGSHKLQNVVARSLGYEENQECIWGLTKDIYFETFFYLSKRFGQPKITDEYKDKDGGTWDFKVKNYTIRICLNSSYVSFIVFGEYRLNNRLTHSSFWIKTWREKRRKKHLLIINLDDVSKRSTYESEQIQNLLNEFQVENNIPDSITPDEFNEKYGKAFWIDKIFFFNEKIIDVDFNDYEKYGEYYNSKTNHALKTLEQFIKNMLTPIWVRDCAFNIKGRVSDSEALLLNRFSNNINIEFEKCE